MMKLCPMCHRDLEEGERMGVLVDHCSHCRGIWLEECKLERVSEYIRGMQSQAEQGNLSLRLIKVYEASVRRASAESDTPPTKSSLLMGRGVLYA